MRRRLSLPFFINALIIGAGALAVGKGVATDYVAPEPEQIVQAGSTSTQTIVSTRRVARRVHGRVVHVFDKVYVRVPVIVVHADHRTIRVPAHNLPLRSAAATVARPLVTVHIPIPVTVYLPTTFYSTVTSTITDTRLVPTTVTVTLPILSTGDDSPTS